MYINIILQYIHVHVHINKMRHSISKQNKHNIYTLQITHFIYDELYHDIYSKFRALQAL